MRKIALSSLLILLLILLTLSCDSESPTIVDRPPVIEKYLPTDQSLQVLLGDTIRFTVDAYDPDSRSLHYQFLIDDSIVSESPNWAYVVHDTGWATVSCIVRDGSQTERIVWSLNRLIPVNVPPVITNYEPDNLNPSYVIGTEIELSMTAEDPEGRPVTYEYLIGKQIVSRERRYIFTPNEIGLLQVDGRAFDGERYSIPVTWNLNITTLPDSILPAYVDVLTLETGTNAGEVYVEWIAVGDDSMEGLPAQYQIRTSSAPIVSEWSWERASDRPGEPEPSAPGDTMRAVISGLIPANFVYVAVRAKDEFGNLSPLIDSPGTKVKGIEITGIVRDALTRQGIPDVAINFASQRVFTDMNGAFEFRELPQYSGSLELKDEDFKFEYGEYYDVDRFYSTKNMDHLDLWMIPNTSVFEPDSTSRWYSSFLAYFKDITDTQENPFGNYLKWYELPIAIYYPPEVIDGIDYEAEVTAVIDEWESLSGIDLFQRVSVPPDTGIVVIYEEADYEREKHEVTEWTAERYPVKSVVHLIKKYTPETIYMNRRVIRHEIGHSLSIKHSLNTNHLMVGGIWPQIDLPRPLELEALQIIFTLPRGEYMENHLFD